MADLELVREVVKRRAGRVFAAIDEGKDPLLLRQHKLRVVSQKLLVYRWFAHSDEKKCNKTPYGFRAVIQVRRDSLGRLYLKELGELPTEALSFYENQKNKNNLIWVEE